MRKIVFLDIDGTLTDFEGKLPDSALEALKMAHQNGHLLVICSGRGLTQIRPFFRTSPLFSGIVCAAGALVLADGKILCNETIPEKELSPLVDFLESTGCYYFLQCTDGIFGTKTSVEMGTNLIGNGRLTPKDREERFGRTDITEHPKDLTNCNKVVYYNLPGTLEEARQRISPYFAATGSSFKFPKGENITHDGEITIASCPKSFGMEQYLKHVDATFADTIAFGDGPNDNEMIESAGIGVAMGNAVEPLKKAADLVTTDIHDNGIWNGFVKTGLIEGDLR